MDKRRGVVAAGSVWESRMKSDQVKGGIKVFKAEKEEQEQEEGNVGGSRLRRTSIGSSKRKTCSPIQISKGKTEEPCISDGIKKRSPIQSRKIRSDMQKGGGEAAGKLRKIKSDQIKKNVTDSIELRKTKSELDRVQENEVDELDDGFEKIEAEKDENVEDFDVCQEKEISSNFGVVQNSPESVVRVGGDSESDGDVVDDEEIEIEMENECFDVKEISIPESKVVIENQQENDKVDVNEPEKKIVMNESEKKVVTNEAEQKKVVNANMRFHHKNERRPVSVPLVVKQSPTIRRNSKIYQNFSKPNSGKEIFSFIQSILGLIRCPNFRKCVCFTNLLRFNSKRRRTQWLSTNPKQVAESR